MFGFMVRAFYSGMTLKAVDIVWATSPTLFQAVAATMVAKLKGKSLLLEIRDVWPDALVDIGAIRNSLVIRAAHGLAKWLYRQADCIVINSPGFRELLVAKGVPSSKIHLVPNGVDTSMFNPGDAGTDVRASSGWTDHFVALYSGAHGVANDLDTLVDAAKALQDYPKILVVMLGDGPEKPRLIEKVKALNLKNVQFLDPVPKSAMPSILAGADCCIAHLVPSAMQAMVYPNKVFDYMAAARPTVLGIGGVIRSVIEQAGGGLPTEPGDSNGMARAIRSLAENPNEGKQMGRSARAYVETHFQRQAIADSLLHVLSILSPG